MKREGRRWTRKEIIQTLRDLESRNGFAGSEAIRGFGHKERESLKLAIQREFETLTRAKETAGLKTWPLWTRERVAYEIRARFAARSRIDPADLRAADRGLADTAQRTFGSLYAALKASGLRPRRPAPPRPRKPSRRSARGWTKESLVLYLREFERVHGFAGSHRLDRVRLRGRTNPRGAARYLFGSWAAAKEAAGLRKWRKWTSRSAKALLLSLKLQGVDLAKPQSVGSYPGLKGSAIRYFGSWQGALKAIGIRPPEPPPPPEAIAERPSRQIASLGQEASLDRRASGEGRGFRMASGKKSTLDQKHPHAPQALRPRFWTRAELLQAIRRTWDERKVVTIAAVQKTAGHGVEYAARRHFGGWSEALRAAGIDRKAAVEKRKRIIEAIRRAAREKEDVRGETVSQLNGWEVPMAATRVFGSWKEALDAAGVQARLGRKGTSWTKGKVLERIRQAWQKGGNVTHSAVVRWNPGLSQAGRRLFGVTWERILRKAGVFGRRRGRSEWTRERVLATFRARGAVTRWNRYLADGQTGLLAAAARHFGSCRAALEAAGIPPPSKPLGLEPDQALRKFLKAWITLSEGDGKAGTLIRRFPRLWNPIRRYFGSCSQALRAGGMEPPGRLPYEPWTKEMVLNRLRKVHSRGEDLRQKNLERRAPGIGKAAFEGFGGWHKAIAAAGITWTRGPWRAFWTPEGVLERLRAEWREKGEVRWSLIDGAFGLHRAACRFFGSWAAAFQRAGVPQPKRGKRMKWTREKILETIQECWARRGDVRSEMVRRHQSGILGRAHQIFGSWRNAVRAAGVPETIPRRRRRGRPVKWTRERVLHEIRKEWEANGKETPLQTMVTRRGAGIPSAASRYFGSWRRALRAAGVLRNKRPRVLR